MAIASVDIVGSLVGDTDFNHPRHWCRYPYCALTRSCVVRWGAGGSPRLLASRPRPGEAGEDPPDQHIPHQADRLYPGEDEVRRVIVSRRARPESIRDMIVYGAAISDG